MHQIVTGARGERTLLVTAGNCIDFMGEAGPRVLSTPRMIGFMERTCRDLALPMLAPGHDTVGTHVNVFHVVAAGIGAVVIFRAEVTGFSERRIEFRVEAHAGELKIGEGTHQRAIVDVAKFAARASAKPANG